MADKDPHWYLDDSKPSLRMWIFSQMAMGAVYAMLIFSGIVLFIFALIAISNILPDDPFAEFEPASTIVAALA